MKKMGMVLVLLLACAGLKAEDPPQIFGILPDFTLTRQDGKKFGRQDLLGRFWVADFIFTSCGGPCPRLTSKMAQLQMRLPQDAQLVSFSVDPEYDKPDVLARYAEKFKADPARWHFLTGSKIEVYTLIRNGFLVGVEEDKQTSDPGAGFIHSTRFVLVDPEGRVRGYYDGDDDEDLKRIERDMAFLSARSKSGWVSRLPAVNAALNATAAALLLLGFRLIRRGNVRAHSLSMSAAFSVSCLFLVSYLYYHAQVGSVPFRGTGWVRPLYFAILLSHTVLAMIVPPMVVVTIHRAWKGDLEKHKAIARWTLPLWLYVSLTGVTIYWMVYGMGSNGNF